MEEIIKNDHSLSYSKNKMVVTGVKEVLSFLDKEVNLNLGSNAMTVRGSGLKVAELNLTNGVLHIDGEVESISYSRSIEKLGLVKRLFK